jgi:hypothetical protein
MGAFIKRREEDASEAVDAAMLQDAALTEKQFFSMPGNRKYLGLGTFVPEVIQERHGKADADRLGAELKVKRDSNPELYADIGVTTELVEGAAKRYAEQHQGNNTRLASFSQAFDPHRSQLLSASAVDQSVAAEDKAHDALSEMLMSAVDVYVAYEGKGDPSAFIEEVKHQLAVGNLLGPAGALGSQETIVATLVDLFSRPEYLEYADEIVEAVRDSDLVDEPGLQAKLTQLVNQAESQLITLDTRVVAKRKEAREEALLDLEIVGTEELRNQGFLSEKTENSILSIPGGPALHARMMQRVSAGAYEQDQLTPEQRQYLDILLATSSDPVEVRAALNEHSMVLGKESTTYWDKYYSRFNDQGMKTTEAVRGFSRIESRYRDESDEVRILVAETFAENQRGTDGSARVVAETEKAVHAAYDAHVKKVGAEQVSEQAARERKQQKLTELKKLEAEARMALQTSHERKIEAGGPYWYNRMMAPPGPPDLTPEEFTEAVIDSIRKDLAPAVLGGDFFKSSEADDYNKIHRERVELERELEHDVTRPRVTEDSMGLF